MLNSSDHEIIGKFKNNVDSTVRASNAKMEGGREILKEVSEVDDDLTGNTGKQARKMGSGATDAAYDAANVAMREVNRHPGATFAAVIAAAITVVGMITFNRRRKRAER